MTAHHPRRQPRRIAALIALLAASGTLLAAAPAAPAVPPAAPERLVVGKHAAPGNDELDPVLRQWFQEQDKLLDQILVRLGRIENLVNEIHRLISNLPVPMATAPVVAPPPAMPAPAPLPKAAGPAPAAKPAPPPPPPPPPPETSPLHWGTLTTGGMLAVLLVLALLRWRRPTAKAEKAAPPAIAHPGPVTAPPAAASQVPSPTSVASTPEVPAISESQQEQAIELAEIMLSMGLGHGAAQTLLEQIRHEPKQALRQWLKLLEIYRRNGQQEEFQRSSEELRLYFNVRPQDWQADPDLQRSVEDYPHIAARIAELWGTSDCLAYLKHLLDDNRGGARTGFPQAVAEEMLLLAGILRNCGIA